MAGLQNAVTQRQKPDYRPLLSSASPSLRVKVRTVQLHKSFACHCVGLIYRPLLCCVKVCVGQTSERRTLMT